MDAFWDKSTLARSTLSARSKFQYQQLDRKIITAIEGIKLVLVLPLMTIQQVLS